jgi:ATP-dependent helicase HrpB
MSATIDSARVAAFLGGCPVVKVPGILHPIRIEYQPLTPLPDAALRLTTQVPGSVLCFLPGALEIRQARRALAAAPAAGGPEVVELHGSQGPAEQDAALAQVPHQRIVLATNIAETSLTVPRVTAVVDSGLHKAARYDPDRAIDSLELERISRDSADQRAGRAGRLGPGVVVRLWSPADRLAPHREPEVLRVDLSGPILEILAWGGDPARFEWFEAPPPESIDAAFDLLDRLGATESGRLTDLGRSMQRLPVHPRLARVLLAAGGSREAALACAVLSERRFSPAMAEAATESDLLSAIEHPRALPAHVLRAADALQTLVRGRQARFHESTFRRALLSGYPDRVGRRREPGSPRLLLASGHGAVLGPESGVRSAEFVVALDVAAGRRGEGQEARVRMASAVDREWLVPWTSRIEHEMGADGIVRAVSREYYGAIALAGRPVEPDPTTAQQLLTEAFLARGLSEHDEQLVRRLRFAGIAMDVRDLAARAVAGRQSIHEIHLAAALGPDVRHALDRDAPESIPVPSGRRARLEYSEDGTITAAVKLQELFGLADTPRVGRSREPVILSLLAPNGRPVQVTRDLRSFWARTYAEVRRELRGRYPKHPWPEDPWTAQPTARTARKGSNYRNR